MRTKEEAKLKNTYKNMLKALGKEDEATTPNAHQSGWFSSNFKWLILFGGVCTLFGVAVHYYTNRNITR